MTKTIYLVYDIPAAGIGDHYQTCPTFDRSEALSAAAGALVYLTPAEKARREIYVGAHTVTVPDGDARTAAEIYDAMLDEDTWPADHDVIPVPDEEA